MIDELDASLAAFLGATAGAPVELDRPSPDWPAAPAKPVLSCFLCHVAEDTDLRAADWSDVRGDGGRVEGRLPPARWYRFRYMVSAWAKSSAEEHQLLGAVMQACVSHLALPARFLAGRLAGEPGPLQLQLANPAPVATGGSPPAHDVWESLGVPLRASLWLEVCAPVRPQLDTDIAPAAEELTLGMRKLDGGSVPRGQLAGASAARDDRVWTTFRIRERAGTDAAAPEDERVRRSRP